MTCSMNLSIRSQSSTIPCRIGHWDGENGKCQSSAEKRNQTVYAWQNDISLLLHMMAYRWLHHQWKNPDHQCPSSSGAAPGPQLWLTLWLQCLVKQEIREKTNQQSFFNRFYLKPNKIFFLMKWLFQLPWEHSTNGWENLSVGVQNSEWPFSVLSRH